MLDPSVIRTLGGQGDAAIAMMDAQVNRVAAMIGYVNDFHLMMIAMIVSLPLIFLLRRPRISAGQESAACRVMRGRLLARSAASTTENQ